MLFEQFSALWPRAHLSKVPNSFRTQKQHDKIANLMITELFFYILHVNYIIAFFIYSEVPFLSKKFQT